MLRFNSGLAGRRRSSCVAFRRSAFALRGVFLACGSKIVNPEKNQGWIKLKKIN
jgi:hypothetical protein